LDEDIAYLLGERYGAELRNIEREHEIVIGSLRWYDGERQGSKGSLVVI
jgi:hypothetical protein